MFFFVVGVMVEFSSLSFTTENSNPSSKLLLRPPSSSSKESGTPTMMIPRRWKSVPFRWKPFLLACGFIYIFMSFLSYFSTDSQQVSDSSMAKVEIIKGLDVVAPAAAAAASHSALKVPSSLEINKPVFQRPNPKIIMPKKEEESSNGKPYYYKMNYEGKEIYIERLMTRPNSDSLLDKTVLDPSLIKSKKKIIALDAGFTQINLGGCPQWECEMSTSGDIATADVLIMQSGRNFERKPHHLIVYYSQESPRNSASLSAFNSFYNMTLGFRHDSPAASPYGYTVKFAPQSRIPEDVAVVDKDLIKGKTKVASWFVSHCGTQSLRERLVAQLQKFIEVDIYGACGPLKCAKGTKCEDSINSDYHFYMALENSICEDYITEKLWNQGYGHTVIPIVLKRSIIEPYVPPNSFIAFDDFDNVQQMAEHMKFLMQNKDEYMKYFDWKRNYQVIYLNGIKHDELERPWGFCQLCRISHILSSNPSAAISFLDNSKLGQTWDNSCESDGSFSMKMMGKLGNDVPKEENAGAKNLGIDSLVTSGMRVGI